MADTKAEIPSGLKNTPWDSSKIWAKDGHIIPALIPKYGDPNRATDNRMARMYLDTDLVASIKGEYTKNSVDASFQGHANDLLNNLTSATPYFSFILEAVNESFEDKVQITETLGDSYVVFGIGKKPRIFSFRGTLLNCEDYDWRTQMINLFEKYISVSRLARFKSKGNNLVTVQYDTMQASGALLNLQTAISAHQEMAAQFSFSMIVTKLATFAPGLVGKLGNFNSDLLAPQASATPASETPVALEDSSSNFSPVRRSS